MPEDAGLEIDFDAELARMQAQETAMAAAAAEAAEPGAGTKVISGQVIDESRTVELMGKRFRVADKIGVMPLLKFAQYSGVAITDMRGLAAMYAMLRDCIHPGVPGCGKCAACEAGSETDCAEYDPGDWAAFEEHAMTSRADADELFKVITDVTEMISGRPTGQPSGSPAGRRAISGGSTARSSGRRAKGSKR